MKKKNRTWKGLVVDNSTQFRLAIICSSVILFPSLIVTVTLLQQLSSQALLLAQQGASGGEIAEQVMQNVFFYAQIIVAVFALCAAISIYLTLKITNKMIGPTRFLESHIKEMLQGNYKKQRRLRQGDYLLPLGDLINQLSEKLDSEHNHDKN